MLNQVFPKGLVTQSTQRFVLDEQVLAHVYRSNAANCNGPELRLQPVYQQELWNKLDDLGMPPSWWVGKRVLDLCCGTGFLSYHLLSRAAPRALTLLDISQSEIAEARRLIVGRRSSVPVDFLCANALSSGVPEETYDVVIGNSFLHHFPDVPSALREFARIVRPGGFFVSLHEPKPGAAALETRNPMRWLSWLSDGPQFVERLRNPGCEVPSGDITDVWLFDDESTRSLLLEAGFRQVCIRNWNLLRPLVVAVASLHLSPQRPRLGAASVCMLALAVQADTVLRKIIPGHYWASLAFAAQK